MEPLKIEITLDRDGTIILAGGDLELVVGRDQGAELWYTRPNKGLAIRFLARPGPTGLALERAPGRPEEVRLRARGFLAKVGFDLPSAQTRLELGVWDETRRVLTTRLG